MAASMPSPASTTAEMQHCAVRAGGFRFWNNEILQNRPGVLQRILEELGGAGSRPSPASGGGKPAQRAGGG